MLYEKALGNIEEHAYKQAEPMLQQCITWYRSDSNAAGVSNALLTLSHVQVELGEFRAARASVEEAKTIKKSLGEIHDEIRALLFESDIDYSVQQYTHAMADAREAASLASAFDDKVGFIDAHGKIADMQLENGSVAQALDEYKNIVAIAQGIGDAPRSATALVGMARAYLRQQKPIEATNTLTEAMNAAQRSQDPVTLALVHTALGEVNDATSNTDAAIRSYSDALSTLGEAKKGKEQEPALLFHVAQVYERTGKFSDAKKYYADAMEAAKEEGDRIAENYLCLFLVRSTFYAMTPQQRSLNYEKLKQSYEQLIVRFHECGHLAGEGSLDMLLGTMAEQSNDLAGAQAYYMKAVTLAQTALAEYSDVNRHLPYMTALGMEPDHADWYRKLSTLLLKLQKPEDALRYCEYIRLRQLAAPYHEVDPVLRHPQLQQQTTEVRGKLAQARLMEVELGAQLGRKIIGEDVSQERRLQADVDVLRRDLNSQSSAILTAYPNYTTLLQPQLPDVNALKQAVPNGSLAVSYLPAEDQLYIFVLTHNLLTVRTFPIHRSELLQLVHEYQSLMQDPNVYAGQGGMASLPMMKRFALLSTQLYNILLRPIENLYDKNLLIATNPEFEGFPFHTIEQQDKRNNVHYAIELTSIDYIPSLQTLCYRTTGASRIQTVTALGNATGQNWALDYELRDIRSFFKYASLITGSEASWSALKTAKGDILQISVAFSQGTMEQPLGAFSLSNGRTPETLSLPFCSLSELSASPVVFLSNQYGQGVTMTSGQAHVVQMNGTADVVMTAWLADRQATKFFSEYFYTHLSNGLAPGDAYRQALLNLIKTRETNNPRSWGQFFHYGVN